MFQHVSVCDVIFRLGGYKMVTVKWEPLGGLEKRNPYHLGVPKIFS